MTKYAYPVLFPTQLHVRITTSLSEHPWPATYLSISNRLQDCTLHILSQIELTKPGHVQVTLR